VWFGLSDSWKIAAILVGVALFVMVFVTVIWLVVKYPQNLVFSEESHVQVAAMQAYGSDSHLLVQEHVKILAPQQSPGVQPGQLPQGVK
jgi:hypothetical protein